MRTGAKKWMPPEYTAIASLGPSPSFAHEAAHAYDASSIQRMTVPPWALPPQFTTPGGTRKRSVVRGASPASV